MTVPRALATAAVALTVVAGLLWIAPPRAAAVTVGFAPAMGEAAFTILIFGPLLLIGWLGGRLTGIPAVAPGRRPGWAGARGLLLGAGGLLLAAGYAGMAGTLHRGGPGQIGGALLFGLGVVTMQVVAEETLFRGWLQPLLARATGLVPAIALTALAFAGLHLLAGATGPVTLLNLLLGGALFGMLAARGGGIAGAVAAHGGWNATEQLALALDPNPGRGAFGALIDLDLTGARSWGGSVEGLNASWAMTFALLIVIVPMLSAPRPHPVRRT